MSTLTLPFKGSLSTNGTVFEIDCLGNGGTAITGSADSGSGVSGTSTSGSGVYGASKKFDAVVGETSSDVHAGVTGRNLTTGANGGVGLYGTGGLLAGKFDGNVVVNGNADADAFNATSASPQHVGVSANNTAGGFGLWASSNGVGIYGRGTTFAGQFDGNVVVNGNASADAVDATSASPQHAGVSANNTAGGFGLWASSNGVGIYGRGTTYAAQFDGTLQVNGDGYITGSLSVGNDIILPAADCAEEFDIATSDEIEPGTVMILDGGGSLRPSEQGYDKKVAGVISGAGDYRPGVILDRRDSSRKRMPLALLGKAYCKVDAQYGSIEVGDLLTTSPTAGHAMKASDPALAFGAVIGKALRPLRCGQALVPILIALQ